VKEKDTHTLVAKGGKQKWRWPRPRKEDTELLIARYKDALEALTRAMDKAVGDLPQLAKDCAVL